MNFFQKSCLVTTKNYVNIIFFKTLEQSGNNKCKIDNPLYMTN